MYWKTGIILFVVILTTIGCNPDPPMTSGRDLTDIQYNPQNFEIEVPDHFPEMPQPDDNVATVEGVELGRHLFYDPIVSVDSSISCSSCHLQELSFTDGLAISPGVNGALGRRSSMSLMDIGYFQNGLFWDGRSDNLEEQVNDPVIDPVEMAHNWEGLTSRLQDHDSYPEMFRKAFGISNSDEISKDLISKALAQFERTLVSSGKSKYDRVIYDRDQVFTDEELNGYEMFFHELNAILPDAECSHCHNGPLFTNNGYFNNGISNVNSFFDFEDYGLGGTSVPVDTFNIGKFRAPSLRNIALTAPYMHDGRFKTLEEVIDHYNSGGHQFVNVDSNLRPLGLTESQKSDLIAFLHTLTDTTFTKNERISNPFE